MGDEKKTVKCQSPGCEYEGTVKVTVLSDDGKEIVKYLCEEHYEEAFVQSDLD